MSTLVEEVKNVRLSISTISNSIAQLPKSRETSLAYTASQRSKMWLGKVLEYLNAEYPYKNDGKRTKVEHIEPEAEKSTDIFMYVKGEEVKVIDEIREECSNIQKSIAKYANLGNLTGDKKFETNCAVSEAWRAMCEIRLWLGWELGRLRDANK